MTPLLVILAGYLGWKLGQRAAYDDTHRIHQMMLDGAATLNEDGTVELVEDWAAIQSEVAREGLQ